MCVTRNGLSGALTVLAVCAALGGMHCCYGQGDFLSRVEWNWLDEKCEDNFRLRFPLSMSSDWPPEGKFCVAFNYSDEGYYVATIGQSACQFLKVKQGATTTLGWSLETPGLRVPSDASVTLKRRDWEMALIVDDRVVAHAYDAEFRGGQIGTGVSSPALKIGDTRFQSVEPLFFSDDFMRGSGEESEWTSLLGEWSVGASKEGTPADPRLSANPFFFRVKSVEGRTALAVAGHWFWDYYAFSAAVRLPSSGTVGLCAYVQDSSRYLVFRLVDKPQGRIAQLVHVAGQHEVILDEQPTLLQPGQWYKLLLVATDQGVKGFVDSEEVCVANAASFGQGKIGVLYKGNGVPPDLQFDDIQVASVRDLTIAEISSVPWTQVTTQVPDTGDRFPLWVTGWPGWRDYRVTAEFTSTANSPVGLCFGYSAPNDYYLLSGRTGGEGHEWLWELWKVSAAGVRSVDRARATMVDRPDAPHDRWHALSAEIIEGCVSVSVDGSVILTAVDAEIVEGKREPGGQVGLLSVENSVRHYRNLAIAFPPDAALVTKVTAQFTKEHTMAQWASPVGDWQNGKDGWIWNRGYFFGDCGFTFPLPSHKGPGYLETILSGDGHDLGKGYRFRTKVQEGKPLSCQLQRNGEIVASRKGVQWEPGATISFRRDRNFIRASLEDQTVLAYCDRDPLVGARTGFGAEGIPLDLKGLNQPRYGTTSARRRQQRGDLLNALGNILLGEILKSNAPEVYRVLQHVDFKIDFVKIFSEEQTEKRRKQKAADPKLELTELSARSPYLYECNFSTAPVDWRAAEGDWQVRQRWTCSPQWTFFGGSGGERPTLWSKPQFFGDHVVEFFAAKPMDPSTGNDTPSDLNLTICGDGEHLDSGYSFVVAGNGGQRNQILRKDKVLAEGPYRLTTNDPHRSWFHIRAQKIGDTLRLSVDDDPALTVVDSEPLRGGSIAFWSNPHGIMIAKVRVWHSGEHSEE